MIAQLRFIPSIDLWTCFLIRVKITRRLVKYQNIGVLDQNPRKREALL
jgi:hypothetical protein